MAEPGSLRERLAAEIEAQVLAVCPEALMDLWQRSQVSVLIERLAVVTAAGRPGRGVTRIEGTARATLIADFPEQLPDERLWARLTLPRSLPDGPGFAHVGRVTLVQIEETAREGWAAQDLVLEFDGDLSPIEVSV